MKDAAATPASQRSSRKRATFDEGLRIRIGALLNERENLQEEVRQLRAAVHIYAEVVRRLDRGNVQCGNARGAA